MNGRLRNESGFALILTLVVTALMVAIVVEMIHQVYVDTSLSRGFRDGQQASILAESGVVGSAKLLSLRLSGRTYSSFSDGWSTPIKLDDEAGSLEISISDECAKLNLNGLVRPNGEYDSLLQAALRSLGTRVKVPESGWAALADWIDSDDQPRSGGAESPYYQALKPPYRARNGRLMTVTELSLVKDFTPQAVASLKPFLTVFTDLVGAPQPTVNINTAPKEVLMALDSRIDERMADRILAERSIQPFKLTSELSRISGMDAVIMNPELAGHISVKSNLYRITSVARVKDSARAVEAVVRLSGSAPEFLSWQEY